MGLSSHAKVSVSLFVILFAIAITALVFGILGWLDANDTDTITGQVEVAENVTLLQKLTDYDEFHALVRSHMANVELYVAAHGGWP